MENQQALKLKAKQFFLADAIGALLSAVMLGIVLVNLQHLIGLPLQHLYLLAGLALLFFTYSIFNYLRMSDNWSRYLKIIAWTNLLYCLFTFAVVAYYFQDIQRLGMIYFGLEILVIIFLASIELKLATKAGLNTI